MEIPIYKVFRFAATLNVSPPTSVNKRWVLCQDFTLHLLQKIS